MLHDMDGFWPARPDPSKTLWNALSGPLRPGRMNGTLTASMAVCLFTEGWAPIDWDILMGWNSHQANHEYVAQVMAAYADHAGVRNAAKANTLSVVRADGLDWIRVVAKRCPRYLGSVPTWSRRALRDLRDERGVKVKDLWQELALDQRAARRVANWHSQASRG